MVKRSRDISFVASLVYFAQGALGISGVALPLYLRSLKWTVTEITTVSSIAAAPWVLKIIYGLVSDTYPLFGYRRKTYLIFFSLISAAGWLCLVLLPPEKKWILTSLLLANLGFAATDVITDGLIVEHSTGVTSSIYQSIAWGARSFGALLSGFAGGWLAAHWIAKDVFALTMFLPLSIGFTIIWTREKKFAANPFHSALTPLKKCADLLFKPNLSKFVGILFIASISSSFGLPFFFFMREHLGFNETFLGLLSSLGWGGAMFGSLFYVKWLRQIPPRLTLRWAILINALNIFLTLLIRNEASALILVFIGGVMGCLVMLPIVSSAAALTHHSGVEGTMFAVLMSMFNIGQIFFGFLGGKLFNVLGLRPLIMITGVLALTGLFLAERLNFSSEHHPIHPDSEITP